MFSLENEGRLWSSYSNKNNMHESSMYIATEVQYIQLENKRKNSEASDALKYLLLGNTI